MKGKVTVNKINEKGERYDFRTRKNLWVDDGKEYFLDFLAGIKSWHNPTATESTSTGLLTFTRYGALGTCMFNNSSSERVAGTYGVPEGSVDYLVEETVLVSPEDSVLSHEVGSRVELTAIRRDQVVEFSGRFDVPGDIPLNEEIREFGLFLESSGPTEDPSLLEAQKPYAMLCRSVQYGTGTTGGSGIYTDDFILADDDLEIRWEFGEV